MNLAANINNDHAQIMDVIKRETDTFLDRDFDGWASCWVQDERSREVCISSSFGATVLEGWDQIKKNMYAVFEAGSGCEKTDFQRNNVSITQSGNIAHVTFDGRSTHKNGRIEQTFETRVLEKDQDIWRFLHVSFVLRGHQVVDTRRLAVDAKGMVLCAPEDALASLKLHSGLRISNGRLRAKTPAWDKELQQGLKSAADLHGFFQHYRYTAQTGQCFRLPVVLGETDEGGVSVCVLSVRDGVTFVDFDGDIDTRLNVAKSIFRLSDGQMLLANRIVSGDSLKAAADTLGISVNTARTHLTRIYAKTGISSQTALVRTLLSVG